MNPNDPKNANPADLAQDMSELKKEGIDILPNDGAQKTPPAPRTAPLEDREKEKFVTDKVPNIFKEAAQAPRPSSNPSPNQRPLGPDILSEASAKLTSSAQVTDAMPKAPPPPPPPPPSAPKSLSDEISNILNPRVGAVTPQAPINSPDIKPLRTYRTDAEEAIRNQRMSVVNIAVAESKREEKRKEEAVRRPPEVIPELSPDLAPAKSGSRLSIPAVLLSIVFLAAGAGAIYFVFIQGADDSAVEPTIVAPSSSLFGESDTRQFPVSNIMTPLESYRDMIGSIEGVRLGDIVRTVPVEKRSGASEPMRAQAFFARSTPSMPGRLLRSIDEFGLGIHEFDGMNPFMVLYVNSFENSFAGMLEWERTIPLELSPLIMLSYGSIDTAGASFHDRVVRNKDARVLRTLDGNDILFYTFTDTGTILIATKLSTLERLVDNLTATRVIR